jgi:hypothetical protein
VYLLDLRQLFVANVQLLVVSFTSVGVHHSLTHDDETLFFSFDEFS